MLIEQKLRVVPEEANNFQIKVIDDTGFKDKYNKKGYREGVDNLLKYLFVLKDEVRQESLTFTELEVEPLQYRQPKLLINLEGEFKDSLYELTMFTDFGVTMSGDGFKGLDFISNVSGASTIFKNYSAIIVGREAYRIVHMELDTLFLDREVSEDFTEFNLGFYDSVKLALYNEIEESILSAVDKVPDCCSDSKTIDSIATLQMYLRAVKESTRRGDYNNALKFLKASQDISKYLNCLKC